MTPREELESLLSGLMDGPLDALGNHRLGELLYHDPALRSDYVDLMQLHALLLWREGGVHSPTPATREAARDCPTEPASERTGRTTHRRSFARKWMLAVALIALGLGMGLLLSRPRTSGTGPELVEQLVGWNVEISQARSLDARQEIYGAHAVSMRDSLSHSELTRDERAMAEALVETGSWLTRTDDPMAEAERFGELADQLLPLLDAATTARDDSRVTTIANAYHRLTEVGLSANVERVLASPMPEFHRKPRLDRLMVGDSRRAKKLEEFLERNPNASLKDVQRAIKGHHHRKSRTGTKGTS